MAGWFIRTGRTGSCADDDLVELRLKKGMNQLLLKVQNWQGTWGFACRPLSQAGLGQKLVDHATRGELDEVQELISHGVGVSARDRRGLTAWQAAKMNGRKDVADFWSAKAPSPGCRAIRVT